MRGCCWDEKPRLSIILLHRRSSSVSHLFALSLHAQRLFSYDSDTGNRDASSSCGGRQWFFFLSLLFFLGTVWLSLEIHPLATLVQLGLPLEYFRCWLQQNICTTTNPLSVFLFFFFCLCGLEGGGATYEFKHCLSCYDNFRDAR